MQIILWFYDFLQNLKDLRISNASTSLGDHIKNSAYLIDWKLYDVLAIEKTTLKLFILYHMLI